jgi:hypothetical protein
MTLTRDVTQPCHVADDKSSVGAVRDTVRYWDKPILGGELWDLPSVQRC